MTTKIKNQNSFKHEFQVFKEDVTVHPIWILSQKGQAFNRQAKIEFYISLGYTITKTA